MAQDTAKFRDGNGRFTKGNPGPPPEKRRKKGQPNKINRDIKEWLLAAAEAIGVDGKGKNGGQGFCEKVGREKAEALLAALVKLLPPTKDEAAVAAAPVTVHVMAMPRGQYLTAEQAAQILKPPQLTVIDNDDIIETNKPKPPDIPA